MNVEGFKEWLRTTDAATKQEIIRKAGYVGTSDESLITWFVTTPSIRWSICHALGVPTDEDILGQATIETARYQKRSYHTAWVAIGISIFAAFISLGSLVVALIALNRQEPVPPAAPIGQREQPNPQSSPNVLAPPLAPK